MPIRCPGGFVHAETVGSFLHPDALIAARHDFEAKAISAQALRTVEDEAIRQVIALQERVGLRVITDGELRRNTYIDFILTGITGVRLEWKVLDQAGYRDTKGHAADTPQPVPTVYEKIRHSPTSTGPDDFKFVQAATKYTAKSTLAGPAVIHFFGGRDAISRDVYPRMEDFWSDAIAAYQQELRELRAAGCRYIQFDETSLIKLVDPAIRNWMNARGDDPDQLLRQYVEVLKAIMNGAPPDMQIALHLCRGNNRGTWQAEGGYGAISRQIFRELPIDVFLLEFDSPRAGSFEPLKELPDDRCVVLGLLSTKQREVEEVDRIVARIDEAAKYVPIERLGVSPQCGFWGGINLCTPAEGEAKLRRVVEIAERVWGSSR
jgi:5-methyltetrahydropteroyltriglutamate--homocysteine methyltransferase